MNRITLTLALIGAITFALYSLTSDDRPTKATVTEVLDGDTIILSIDGGATYHCRLIGYDAPELPTRPGWEAKEALTTLTLGREVTVQWGDHEGRLQGHYDRWLVHLTAEGESVNRTMKRLLSSGREREDSGRETHQESNASVKKVLLR